MLEGIITCHPCVGNRLFMSLLCSTTLEYAGSSASWTDGVRALPEVPTECLNFNLKIPRHHIPEACAQVRQFVAVMVLCFLIFRSRRKDKKTTSLPLHVCLLCSHHLLASVYESKGEFRSALQHEKEAYSIYKSQVGLLEYHVCWCSVYAHTLIILTEKRLCCIHGGR